MGIFFHWEAHWGICIPGNIFLVEVDVIAGGFIWWQAIPNATANTKGTGLMVRLGCLLLIKTNWHNIYLQAAPKLWTINIHFLVAQQRFHVPYESGIEGAHFDAWAPNQWKAKCRSKGTLIFYGGILESAHMQNWIMGMWKKSSEKVFSDNL